MVIEDTSEKSVKGEVEGEFGVLHLFHVQKP